MFWDGVALFILLFFIKKKNVFVCGCLTVAPRVAVQDLYFFRSDLLAINNFGDNSVALRPIGRKIWGNSSYKPPGASCAAQGAQKHPEMFKNPTS